MAKEIVLTSEGRKKLEEELEQLVTVKRKEIAESIQQAREYGDLSENSEYDEAKNDQAQTEARIAQIEGMLKNAKIVDNDAAADGAIRVGSKVKVYDEEFEEELVYEIVGMNEADPMLNKVSYESPVGKALLGRKVGEETVVEAPAGNIRLKILSFEQ